MPVALNRLATEYDHVLICGPVFPHEVVGFSGGTKYLFPGIAAPDIIHFTHWLGALITSSEVIGTIDTPGARDHRHRGGDVEDAALAACASSSPTKVRRVSLCGDPHEAWREAALLSQRRHVTFVERAFDHVLAVMPAMYDDLWTGAKGAYKTEPVVADGGEVIIYAPHIDEVSYVHGALIDRDRLSLPRLLSRAVGPVLALSVGNPRPLDPRQGARHVRRGNRG